MNSVPSNSLTEKATTPLGYVQLAPKGPLAHRANHENPPSNRPTKKATTPLVGKKIVSKPALLVKGTTPAIPIRKAHRQANHATKKATMAKLKTWTTKDLQTYALFEQQFVEDKLLGSGGDGIVVQYRHRVSGDIIAVKTSRAANNTSVRGILAEIKQYDALGVHENICAMLTYCGNFRPKLSPAIFFPVCNWDLRSYKNEWHSQQKLTTGKSDGIPEITVMKLMRDISLGLDFLHNAHHICYVHNDIKPGNILVAPPPGYTAEDIPAEPIFKITDFGRTTIFPCPPKGLAGKWRGTFEYGPPRAERTLPPKPGVDVWSFGATIQRFALDLNPTESRMAVIRRCQRASREHPDINDDKAWGDGFWRAQRNVLYRPINVSYQTLRLEYDVPTREPEYYRQYSTKVSHWYDMIMLTPAKFRANSSFLAKVVVPFLDRQMAIEREMELSRKNFATAVALLDVTKDIAEVRQKYTTDIQEFRRQQPDYSGLGYGSQGFDGQFSVHDSSHGSEQD